MMAPIWLARLLENDNASRTKRDTHWRSVVLQTSPKSPLRMWGAKPTVPVVHQFDE